MSEPGVSGADSNADTRKRLQEIDEQGYCVLEDVIDGKLLDERGAALDRIERDAKIEPAKNDCDATS